jgi:hypothetical protein
MNKRTLRQAVTIGAGVGGLALFLNAIGSLNRTEAPAVDEVPLSAIQQGVDHYLGQATQEKRAEREAEEAALIDDGLGVAYQEVSLLLEEAQQLQQDAVNCARASAIYKKVLQRQEEDGISLVRGLQDELKNTTASWSSWASKGAAVAGDATGIQEPRALNSDTIAVLLLLKAYLSDQSSIPICDDMAGFAFNLNATQDAVASGLSGVDQLTARAMQENALRARWVDFQKTGDAAAKEEIEDIAQATGLDLKDMGIDLNSVAVKEAQ